MQVLLVYCILMATDDGRLRQIFSSLFFLAQLISSDVIQGGVVQVRLGAYGDDLEVANKR